jgi:hypothetical protein
MLSVFRRDMPASPNNSEKISCHEFADILAWYVLRQIKENRDQHPNPDLRLFAKSVKADADAEIIDNEILFLLSCFLSQICAFYIDDRSYLDELIPRFYHVLANQRSSKPSIFEAIAISRYMGYGEAYDLDIEKLHRGRAIILWKFMLSQFGKNLRSDFDFDTEVPDFLPASMALGAYYKANMEYIKKTLPKLDFGKCTS